MTVCKKKDPYSPEHEDRQIASLNGYFQDDGTYFVESLHLAVDRGAKPDDEYADICERARGLIEPFSAADRPQHYDHGCAGYPVSPINVCARLGFCVGNAVKYITRAGRKEGNSAEQDLAKALFYLREQLVRTGYFSVVINEPYAYTTAMFYKTSNAHLDKLFRRDGVESFEVNPGTVAECMESVAETVIELRKKDLKAKKEKRKAKK